MMEEFTTALYDDLHELRRQMSQTARDLEVNFKEAKLQAQDWKATAQENFESLTDKIKVSRAV